MNATMLYVHALSPIHVGVGQGAGIIDLPIIRETATNLPFLPGSSLKGVIRDASDQILDKDVVKGIFGPKRVGSSEEASAGTGSFTDARLLFFPVRTYKGSFAWVTSPLVLTRWGRDCSLAGVPVDISSITVDPEHILLSNTASTTLSITKQDGRRIVQLEDLDLTEREANDAWTSIVETVAQAVFPSDETWRKFFTTHVGVVTDTTFSYLAVTATEVIARNRIDDQKKTVVDGALWWEEAVPAESIFSGMVVAAPRVEGGAANLAATLAPVVSKVIQIGGDATIGRGIAQILLPGGS